MRIVHAYPVAAAEHDVVPAQKFDRVPARVTGDARAIAQDAQGVEDDIEVIVDAVNEYPAPALLEAAQDASMLVVGTRGHGPVVGTLLGSVSQRCVAKAACPVVVVHPAPVGSDGDDASDGSSVRSGRSVSAT